MAAFSSFSKPKSVKPFVPKRMHNFIFILYISGFLFDVDCFSRPIQNVSHFASESSIQLPLLEIVWCTKKYFFGVWKESETCKTVFRFLPASICMTTSFHFLCVSQRLDSNRIHRLQKAHCFGDSFCGCNKSPNPNGCNLLSWSCERTTGTWI